MISLKVENNDLVFGSNGELELIDGREEAVQSLERTLTTRKGEFYLNNAFGFDYSAMQTKRPNNDLIRLAVVDAVTQDSRFESVKDLAIDLDSDRRLNLDFKIKTANGAVLESEVTI